MQTITRIVLCQQARKLAGQRGLAGALAGGDDRDGGGAGVQRLVARRLEPQPRCLVGQAVVQRVGGQAQLLPRRQHGLVGQVEHRVGGAGASRPQRRLGVVLDRPPVDLRQRPAGQLLLAPAEHHAGEAALRLHAGEQLTHRGGMVLAVDERDDRHARV